MSDHCPACGNPWTAHSGIAAMCAKLQNANREIERLRADYEELRAGMIEHAQESARQLDDLLKTRSQLERLRRGGG